MVDRGAQGTAKGRDGEHQESPWAPPLPPQLPARQESGDSQELGESHVRTVLLLIGRLGLPPGSLLQPGLWPPSSLGASGQETLTVYSKLADSEGLLGFGPRFLCKFS